MSDTDSNPKFSAADRRNMISYTREFVPAMVAYALILILVLTFVDQDSAAAKFWILLPIVPLLFVVAAVYRSLQRADEYGRLIQLEGMALAFGASMIAAVVFGFLGVAGVATVASGWIVFVVGMMTWGVSVSVRAFR